MVEKFNETDLMKEIKSCTYEQDYETAVKLADIPRRNTTIKNLFPLRHGIYIGIFSDIVWTREKANGFRFSSIRLNS